MDIKESNYTKPALTRHGTVEELTQGGRRGTASDAVFPVGTPVVEFTLS